MLRLSIIKLDQDGSDEKVIKTLAINTATSIGRHTTADIKINDRSISRLHCFLVPTTDNRLKVRDLNSETGTIVDNERINETTLITGKCFYLGHNYRIEIKEITGKTKYKDQRTFRDEDSEDTNF